MGVRRDGGADHSTDSGMPTHGEDESFRFNQLRKGDEEAYSVLAVVADYNLKCLQCGGPLGEGSQGEFCAKCAANADGSTN